MARQLLRVAGDVEAIAKEVAPKLGLPDSYSIKAAIEHNSKNPFVTSVRMDGTTVHMTFPPTIKPHDRAHIYPFLIECLDGAQRIHCLDLTIAEDLRRMQRAHLWGQRRLRFTLAHELSHIANGDMDPRRNAMDLFFKAFSEDKRRQMRHDIEYAADLRAAKVDLDAALGGVEHVGRIIDFYDTIKRGFARIGRSQENDETVTMRLQTHPLERDRVLRILDLIRAEHKVEPVAALCMALGPDPAAGSQPLPRDEAELFSRELGLSKAEGEALGLAPRAPAMFRAPPGGAGKAAAAGRAQQQAQAQGQGQAGFRKR